MELLVVLVIIGIMSAIAFQRDGGQKAKEFQYGEGCESDLRLIFNAEKSYRIEKGSYLSASSVRELNRDLGISIQNTRFDFQIRSNSGRFTVTATRKDGRLCGGRTMSITQTGALVKECAAW